MNSELEKICLDGTNLEDKNSNVGGFALHTLKLGLRAYFSTYKACRYGLNIFERNEDEKTKDKNTPDEFFEYSAETILHFHHFTELIFKDILRTEHPLLADTAPTKPIVMKKLLKGEQLNSEEEAGLRSIEFKETLERLIALINGEQIQNYHFYVFISNNKNMLEKLNTLRNRIWHRGKFILRYDSLDKFVCQYFLPFLREILKLDKYNNHEINWKYRPLKIDFDPLDYLYEQRDQYDVGKFSFAKELGRAAYENPLVNADYPLFKIHNELERHKSKRIAEIETTNKSLIYECPVCGSNSLVLSDDAETQNQDGDSQTFWFTWKAKCTCCTFEIYNELKNGKDYGIPIEDYWIKEKL